jgi:glutaminase|nr:glutaminase [Candidatus Krumholzibacteria bacterium]
MPDYSAVLQEIEQIIQPSLSEGQVASYIPELGAVPLGGFAMALIDDQGQVHRCGAAHAHFSIQSISKLFTLALVLREMGPALWEKVGREPSGSSFNSLLHLEYEDGRPRNPFINAGAMVVTDLLLGLFPDPRETILSCMRRLSGNPMVDVNPAVALSEKEFGFRNASLANFLKSYGRLDQSVDAVLATYFWQCALEMSVVDLARAGYFLMNQGVPLGESTSFISPNRAKYLNSLMLTCGTYDSVGDFAYRVGLPAKSGVGGGILAVMPGQFSVAVWSPGLDASGNSLTGTLALEHLTTLTGISVF